MVVPCEATPRPIYEGLTNQTNRSRSPLRLETFGRKKTNGKNVPLHDKCRRWMPTIVRKLFARRVLFCPITPGECKQITARLTTHDAMLDYLSWFLNTSTVSLGSSTLPKAQHVYKVVISSALPFIPLFFSHLVLPCLLLNAKKWQKIPPTGGGGVARNCWIPRYGRKVPLGHVSAK